MALQKQPVTINFSKGLDLKTDPNQVAVGNFLSLKNSVFDVAGRLTKRNGFADITQLPNTDQTTLTTLADSLIATGSNLYAYSADINQWINKGSVQPVRLDTVSLLRNSTSQTSADTAVAPNGLAVVCYTEGSSCFYQVSDSVTGQQIVSRQVLTTTGASPRAFILGRYFIVTFLATVSGTPHLRYIGIPMVNPTSPTAITDISTVVESLSAGYDAYVCNNNLYVAWGSTSTTIRIGYLSSALVNSAPITISSHKSNLMAVTADTSASTPVIWVSYWDSTSTNAYTSAYNQNLAQILAPTLILSTVTISELTSIAASGINTIFYETLNTYTYTPNARTDFVSKVTATQAGVVGSPSVVLRSVGLASKPFTFQGVTYIMVAYGEMNQPTYFLINSSGSIFMRLAGTNGGGYEANQVLPTASIQDDIVYVPYLIKDFLAAVNKSTALPSGTPTNGIYTQTGVSLAKFSINTSNQYSSEIAGALHLTGGQMWEYDGVKPVEHGFHVYPENIAATTATGSGGLTAQQYYYVFTYEWTDNAGNLQRSAPSIPVGVVTTTASSTNMIHVPTLRLTDKIAPNPVRIVGYRWSTAQPVYYQFTSITSPTINDPTVDHTNFTDAAADSAILGQTLLYTTGGVLENIAPPAAIASTLFKNRLFIVDAEDQNLLWYSKQVIENTPVEMSDLLTLYVAPTSGAQGSTGPVTALGAMDDKLIIFKRDAIYYITGNGPDNTGANNDFGDPVFITSSVGCSNPNSIVLMPNGLMFQSDKGIWLLDRSLNTNYIGAPVEQFNDTPVVSAETIPGTNQVRFIIPGGTTLMFDYFFAQWGTFSNVDAISATLYQGQHTYLNQYGHIFQETPGTYLDGSTPVLLSFTTSWMNVAGLRGYERFYFAFLLGTYITPFKLNVAIAYDFNKNATQNIMVTPDNYSPNYGDDTVFGATSPFGGPGNVFQARLFPEKQKCQTFQLTITELYDSSFGVAAGEGLTLSGMNLVIGVKKGFPTQRASKSFG